MTQPRASGQQECERDLLLVQSALSGSDSAAEEIRLTARRVACIVESDWRDDSSTRAKSSEIVADLLADCFGATQRNGRASRLLELYGGRAPLQAWLLICARSRVSNWRRSLRFRLTTSLSQLEENGEEPCDDGELLRPADDEAVHELLKLALQKAFETLGAEQIVLIRLVYLHGVARERLAALWEIHPSNVGRRISDGLAQVRSTTLLHLRAMDPFLDLTWEDCLAICAEYPRLVHGDF